MLSLLPLIWSRCFPTNCAFFWFCEFPSADLLSSPLYAELGMGFRNILASWSSLVEDKAS